MPWLDAIAGAIAACHCEKPLREKIHQSVTQFPAALFSALITHKNWLVLSGVYAGIIWNLTLSPHELTKWRIDTLTRWSKMAVDLNKDESELKSKIHPKVRKCFGMKRLLLLEALAKQIGWEDEQIHSDLRSGFKLTGYCPPTGTFERECKPAVLDKPALMRQSLFLRPMI